MPMMIVINLNCHKISIAVFLHFDQSMSFGKKNNLFLLHFFVLIQSVEVVLTAFPKEGPSVFQAMFPGVIKSILDGEVGFHKVIIDGVISTS